MTVQRLEKSVSLNLWDTEGEVDFSCYQYLPNMESATELTKLVLDFCKDAWEKQNAELEKAKEHTETFIKSLNEEQQLFTAVVLRPEVVDAHGDIYSHEAVEGACIDYMLKSQRGNLQHYFNTDQLAVAESYIAKSDALDGKILTGDWVMTMKVLDTGLWEDCKNGVYTGFSIGCNGAVENIED